MRQRTYLLVLLTGGIMKKVFVLAALSLLGSLSFAGNSSSGGGIGVVCNGAQGKIQSVELLDLYEGRVRYHLNLVSSSGNTEQDYLASVKRLWERYGWDNILINEEVRRGYANFFDKIQWTKPGKKLAFLNDQGETAPVPANCHLEQIVIFTDFSIDKNKDQEIKMDSDLWARLTSLEQAALIQHELFYVVERSLFEKTSEGTRAGIAALFSTNAIPVLAGIPAGSLRCESDNNFGDGRRSKFYMYATVDANKVSHLTFQFQDLMGRLLFNKATIPIDGIRFLLKKTSPKNTTFSIVAEENMKKSFRVPLTGGHRDDWEVSMQYETGKPVKLGLYQKGILIEENLVRYCEQK